MHGMTDTTKAGTVSTYGVRLACLESLQVVGEVREQALLLVRLEGGLTPDWPVKASQSLLADVGRLRQHMRSEFTTCVVCMQLTIYTICD